MESSSCRLGSAEFKHFDVLPSSSTWYAPRGDLLAQLLCNMIGNMARLGVFVSNVGIKVLLMEPPLGDSEFSECFIWNESDRLVDFGEPAHMLGLFEFMLEVLRLFVPHEENVLLRPARVI